MAKPLVSVIIIVKNDPRVIPLVEYLIQSSIRLEVIVVDASDILTNHQSIKVHKNVRWLPYNQRGRHRTIPHQRNYGLKHASGDVIVFTDADCTPSPQWLKSLVTPIIKNKESITTGPIIVKGYMALPHGSHYVRYAGNGNLAFSRQVYRKVGFYDETMSVAEDYDYCMRARRQGFRITFINRAVVHHPNDTFRKNITKSFVYGRGAARLYIKHPREIGVHAHFLYSLFYAGYILLLPVTVIFPYCPLLIAIPALLRFPRNPLKEVINVSFGLGVLVGCVRSIWQ